MVGLWLEFTFSMVSKTTLLRKLEALGIPLRGPLVGGPPGEVQQSFQLPQWPLVTATVLAVREPSIFREKNPSNSLVRLVIGHSHYHTSPGISEVSLKGQPARKGGPTEHGHQVLGHSDCRLGA